MDYVKQKLASTVKELAKFCYNNRTFKKRNEPKGLKYNLEKISNRAGGGNYGGGINGRERHSAGTNTGKNSG